VFKSDSDSKYLFYSDFYKIIVDFNAEEKVKYEKSERFILDIKPFSSDKLFEFYINWKEVAKQKMEAPINTKKFNRN